MAVKNEFTLKLTAEQKEAKALIFEKPFTFLLGEPGSGKTLLAVQVALDLYFKGDMKKIVITRPTVSSERNGFLPGSINEKLQPWMVPIISNMYKMCKKETIDKLLQSEDIEILALSYFRGRHFEKAVCIVDEFQNLNQEQLSMCVSRLGKDSIMIFTGDEGQIDLPDKSTSAIKKVDALEKSQYVNKIILKENHRHPALKEILGILNS